MPRSRRHLWAALLPALALLPSCSGSDDPTTPVNQVPTAGSYFQATITLLDTDEACVPGVSCAPEFLDCTGDNGFLVGRTWTVEGQEFAGGARTYQSTPGNPVLATLLFHATDLETDAAASVAIRLVINRAGTWTSQIGSDPQSTYVNVDVRCTEMNTDNDPVTQFRLLGSPAATVDVTTLPLDAGADIVFAQADASGVTGGMVEGTFSFTAENRQVFGRVYTARVRVDGCFRVPVTAVERALELDPAASAPCP